MKKDTYAELGKNFYNWYKEGGLKFIYCTEGQNLSPEIERISELIDYVREKIENLSH